MTLYKGQGDAFDSCLKQSYELDIKCTDMIEAKILLSLNQTLFAMRFINIL